MKINILFVLILLGNLGCQAQNNKSMTDNNSNPLLCDPKTGVCEMPQTKSNAQTPTKAAEHKALKVIYFTDPICSSCWGIEPQLRRLKLEYGDALEIEYHMGGLLPDWSYNSGGISKPSDVAHHWDEVSAYYDMPIDGDVWLEDPLSSSYPPSIAFKAAQLQDEQKAIKFLRRLREMVFLEKKNITKWEYMSQAAKETGLDADKLKQDYEGSATTLFQKDLELSRSFGVRGFPTLFFVDSLNNQQVVYGFRPYKAFEDLVVKALPKVSKFNYDKSWTSLFAYYPTLTTREFSELSDLSKTDSEQLLQSLADKGQLIKQSTKNGPIWVLKK